MTLATLAMIIHSLLSSTNNCSLEVEVDTQGRRRGKVMLALFRDQDNFPEQSAAFQGIIEPADQETIRHTFSNLAPGHYAIAAYHDLNSNGKLDRNFLGVPTEPYAFSNNPSVKWSTPSFEEAALQVEPGKQNVKLILRQWSEH
jgi:uncharacterized protein (DUF2141 family)